jgi:hypothetical protein
MQVHVVFDDQGRIVSIGKPGDVAGRPSGIRAAGVLTEPGQHFKVLELAKEWETEPLLNLHSMLRVEAVGERVRLVASRDFIEPFRRMTEQK